MMAEMFMDGFHGIYLCLLGRSGASDGGPPNLIGEVGDGEVVKGPDSLVETNLTFL